MECWCAAGSPARSSAIRFTLVLLCPVENGFLLVNMVICVRAGTCRIRTLPAVGDDPSRTPPQGSARSCFGKDSIQLDRLLVASAGRHRQLEVGDRGRSGRGPGWPPPGCSTEWPLVVLRHPLRRFSRRSAAVGDLPMPPLPGQASKSAIDSVRSPLRSPGMVEMSLGGEPGRASRGLPEPQCLDTGARRWTAAGHGLDPWRVLRVGIGSREPLSGGMLARDRDVVVVTVNYRLGILGFLAHPALADPGQAWLDGAPWTGIGNWGLADQIAALAWVHRSHRRVRRRSGQCDPVRRVGRRDERGLTAGCTRGTRVCSTGRSSRAARPTPVRRIEQASSGRSRSPPTWYADDPPIAGEACRPSELVRAVAEFGQAGANDDDSGCSLMPVVDGGLLLVAPRRPGGHRARHPTSLC